jgi:hypothetical protein
MLSSMVHRRTWRLVCSSSCAAAPLAGGRPPPTPAAIEVDRTVELVGDDDPDNTSTVYAFH